VHLNLPFREPLVPTGAPLVDALGRTGGRPWMVTTTNRNAVDPAAAQHLASIIDGVRRGVIVAGYGASVDAATINGFSAATGWPVIADAVSNARVAPDTIASYEALLRAPSFASSHRPDVVLRVGAPLTSKVANDWLDGVPLVLLDEHGTAFDPPRAAAERFVAPATPLLDATTRLARPSGSAWLSEWHRAERDARDAIDTVLDADDEPCEARLARDVAACTPDGGHLAVASSLPVRALEWCMAPRDGITVHANRGANGIDGFVSTVVGIAMANRGDAPTIALLGDLCFLHDTNGLLAARDVHATFVVVDNRGGGIFSSLPQHHLPEFESLFATPQDVDIAAVAVAHGVPAERVAHASDVPGALKDAVAAGGVRVIVVPVDRDRSAERHRALWDRVARRLAA
jgi:2-succinyl-5-enolpyruvyl-6-hydroxy-3-cyclohexene-1-carboxylate synthase